MYDFLYLGTNTLWCHDIYQYINKTGEKQINFNHENETVCSASKTWHWFNTTEQVPLKQVRYLSLVIVSKRKLYLIKLYTSAISCNLINTLN